jgi:molybdopterin converting factor small subunit
MQIKQVHCHFLISIGNYSNERIGFSVELSENETPEQVVQELRERAKQIVGQPADELYSDKCRLEAAIRELERKLASLRKEWDATAEFLKAQGIRPDAPSMPQFNNLLKAAKVEEEAIGELVDVF